MHEVISDNTLTSDEIAKKVSVIFFELVQYLSENTEKKDKIPPDAEVVKNQPTTDKAVVGFSLFLKVLFHHFRRKLRTSVFIKYTFVVMASRTAEKPSALISDTTIGKLPDEYARRFR